MSWLTDSSRSRRISWNELQKLSDNELFRELISGRDDAFAVIVDRYQRLVFSVALRIVKDEGEAEDLVQIVFADKKTEQIHLTGTLVNESIQEALEALQLSSNFSGNNFHYHINQNIVSITK